MTNDKNNKTYRSAKHSATKHNTLTSNNGLSPREFSNMRTTENINLNKFYFEYKVFTKIIGEPTFDKFHEIFWQLKANMAAVPCTLGGEANRYLVILVSDTQYNTVAPGAPFVTPPMPGALVINIAYTQYQIAMSKTQYKTALREHQTYILMQR